MSYGGHGTPAPFERQGERDHTNMKHWIPGRARCRIVLPQHAAPTRRESRRHPDMSDVIIVDGDTVNFLPSFGAATVVPIPTTIKGTASKTKVTGKKACLEGDEKDV